MIFQRLFCLVTGFAVGKIFLWSLGIQPICLSLLSLTMPSPFAMENSVEVNFKALVAYDLS